MMKALLGVLLVGMFVLALPQAVRGNAPQAQGASVISAAEAAPFLGDWTLTLQGPNGPGTFALSIGVEKEKVVAEIASEMLTKQPISSIVLRDKSLVLGYTFNYEGNPVDAVVTLTPDKDGKTAAQISFASGAYVMDGTATKKDKEK